MPMLNPSQTWTILPGAQPSPVPEHRVLIVGQMTSAGSATSGALQTDIQDNTNTINSLFGQNSHIAGMVRRFKLMNKVSTLDAIALDDATGTAGTCAVDFTGSTPTESGSIYVTVMSETNHKYKLDITTSSTATTIGDALVAAITADGNAPFAGVNTAGDVVITCDHDGTMCNDWSVKVDGTVAGVRDCHLYRHSRYSPVSSGL